MADQTPAVFKAKKELKGFSKIYLEAGEERRISMRLNRRSFAHYDVKTGNWEVSSGIYQIQVGVSSADIRLTEEIEIQGTIPSMDCKDIPGWYLDPAGKPPVRDFKKLYGRKIKPFEPEKPGQFTMLNTFHDMKDNPVVSHILEQMRQGILQGYGGDESNPEFIFTFSIITNTPLVRLVQQGGGQTPLALMQTVVGAANHDPQIMAQFNSQDIS